MSTFFISTLSYSKPCPIPDKLELARVKWVYDGDTLKLTDNRKLRIIGIDTPEVAHQKKKAEAYSGQATEALRALLKKHDYQIYLSPGIQNKDKYGRLLAHVYTPDNINISNWLLEQGLATSLILPPNHRFAKCYRDTEKQAQQENKKIWQQPQLQPQRTGTLNKKYRGYVRLSGTVHSIKRRKNKTTIQLDQQIYITIKEPELSLFGTKAFKNLKGKQVQVTGLLYRHGKKRYIRIHHPVYLERL